MVISCVAYKCHEKQKNPNFTEKNAEVMMSIPGLRYLFTYKTVFSYSRINILDGETHLMFKTMI